MQIQIDLNELKFQQDLFQLDKKEIWHLFSTLQKISRLTWAQLYADHGLKWEAVGDKQRKKFYTFRFSQKYRALAMREDNYLRLLSLHIDHNSAYK